MTTTATIELVRRGVRAVRRASGWWAFGILAMALISVAYWPSLEGNDALEELYASSEDLMAAFGAENLSTAAGYLDGQLYALMLPLLFAGLSIAVTSAITAGDEDKGRLELLLALPVSRRRVWLARLAAASLALGAVVAATALLVALSIGLFSLEGVTAGRVVTATVACGLLGAFHGCVAWTVGAVGGSRGVAVGTAVGVLVAGYMANFLLPLADSLAAGRRLSPWWWAIGSQPVSDGLNGAWLLLLIGVGAALVGVGAVVVERRDVRGA